MDGQSAANIGKFQNPFLTAKNEARASVALTNPQTLWFNTGTLCNIECENCYILSSPTNDALVYLKLDEVKNYLDQLDQRNWKVDEIGFTGGEPFMNPEFIAMCEASCKRGYRVLILTNAMQPMMRRSVREPLKELIAKYRKQLTFRVSLDHHSEELHDIERGKGSFHKALIGMQWLRDQNAQLAVAGRTMWNEAEADAREGFRRLFEENRFEIDAANPGQTVLFPEMDEMAEVPEITTACWGILNKSPNDMMCASSRMVVRRKGAEKASVVACTLLPYDEQFELGTTLQEAEQNVQLNHPHCAKFCVLGGASCTA